MTPPGSPPGPIPRQAWERAIHRAYGPAAEGVIALEEASRKNESAGRLARIDAIQSHWEEITALPGGAAWLRRGDGAAAVPAVPCLPEEIGVDGGFSEIPFCTPRRSARAIPFFRWPGIWVSSNVCRTTSFQISNIKKRPRACEYCMLWVLPCSCGKYVMIPGGQLSMLSVLACSLVCGLSCGSVHDDSHHIAGVNAPCNPSAKSSKLPETLYSKRARFAPAMAKALINSSLWLSSGSKDQQSGRRPQAIPIAPAWRPAAQKTPGPAFPGSAGIP